MVEKSAVGIHSFTDSAIYHLREFGSSKDEIYHVGAYSDLSNHCAFRVEVGKKVDDRYPILLRRKTDPRNCTIGDEPSIVGITDDFNEATNRTYELAKEYSKTLVNNANVTCIDYILIAKESKLVQKANPDFDPLPYLK